MIAVLRDLRARQPVLSVLGWAMLGVLLVSMVGLAVDPRSLNGVSVWVKPAKFAASLAVWSWTLGWASGVVAPEARRGITARIVAWGTVVAGGYEQAWITLRAAQGLPSHFATDPLGALAFSLMGFWAMVLVALAFVLGVLVLLRPAPGQDRAWVLAVGLGLIISGVLGGFTGASIGALGGPIIGGSPSDAGAWPPFFWSRDGGDLRIAHFLAIHAMQGVPAMALVSGRGTVVVGAGLWVVLTIAAHRAALAGVPLPP
jgi:hypothetical protein